MLKNYLIGQRRPINLLEQKGFLNNSRLHVEVAALPPTPAAHLALLIQTEGRAGTWVDSSLLCLNVLPAGDIPPK